MAGSRGRRQGQKAGAGSRRQAQEAEGRSSQAQEAGAGAGGRGQGLKLNRKVEKMAAAMGFRDLKVYQLAYKLAMEIFHESKSFPPEEKYSLTDQIRRSSRSVPANIAEGYRKRQYEKMFVSKMADADGEATETQVWLDFVRDCGYLSKERQEELTRGYEEVGRMLGGMIAHPEKFAL